MRISVKGGQSEACPPYNVSIWLQPALMLQNRQWNFCASKRFTMYALWRPSRFVHPRCFDKIHPEKTLQSARLAQ